MATTLDISKYLQCPICKNLFKDPVTTGCGHSFCQRCLDQHISMRDQQCPLCEEAVCTKPRVNATLEILLQEFLQTQMSGLDLYTGKRGEIPCSVCEEDLTFRAVKSCLTCLQSYCERHLIRHQSLERHRHHKLVNPVEKLEERACREHGRPLELYSRRDERLICILCVNTGEYFIPEETETERIEAEQQPNIEEVESMIRRSENKLKDLQNTFTQYKAEIDREKKEIKDVFAEVMEVVRKAKEEMLTPLEDGGMCLEVEWAEKTQPIRKEILKYRKILTNLKQNNTEEDDILFLQSEPIVPAEFIHDRNISIETDLRFGSVRQIISDALASIGTKMENLCSLDIRRIQRVAVDVPLNEETAHPSLEVSERPRKRSQHPVQPSTIRSSWWNYGKVFLPLLLLLLLLPIFWYAAPIA